jgi:hypothetical protein
MLTSTASNASNQAPMDDRTPVRDGCMGCQYGVWCERSLSA